MLVQSVKHKKLLTWKIIAQSFVIKHKTTAKQEKNWKNAIKFFFKEKLES